MKELVENVLKLEYPKKVYLKNDSENRSLGILIQNRFIDTHQLFSDCYSNKEEYQSILNYFPELKYDPTAEENYSLQRVEYLLVANQILLEEQNNNLCIAKKNEMLTAQHFAFHLIHESKSQPNKIEIFELIQKNTSQDYDLYLLASPYEVDDIFLCHYILPENSYNIIKLNSQEGICYLADKLDKITALPFQPMNKIENEYFSKVKTEVKREAKKTFQNSARMNYLCREAVAFACQPLPMRTRINYLPNFTYILTQLDGLIKSNPSPVLTNLFTNIKAIGFSYLDEKADFRTIPAFQHILQIMLNPVMDYKNVIKELNNATFQIKFTIFVGSKLHVISARRLARIAMIISKSRSILPLNLFNFDTLISPTKRNVRNIYQLADKIEALKLDFTHYIANRIQEHTISDQFCCHLFGTNKAFKINAAEKILRFFEVGKLESFNMKEVAAVREFHFLRNRPSNLAKLYLKHKDLIELVFERAASIKSQQLKNQVYEILNF